MKKSIKLAEFDFDTNEKGIEVEIHSESNDNELEMTLKGIEKLISSIDLDMDFDGDYELYKESMKRILFAVSDHVGFAANYYRVDPSINIEYDEFEEGRVSNVDKIKVLRTFISEL